MSEKRGDPESDSAGDSAADAEERQNRKSTKEEIRMMVSMVNSNRFGPVTTRG